MERVIKYVEPSNVIFKRQQSQPVRQILRKENASVESRNFHKSVNTTKFDASSIFKIAQTSVGQSKRVRKAEITKNSQSYAPQKKELLDGGDNERSSKSFQAPGLKIFRLSNEKCITAISHLKRSYNVPRMRKSCRRYCLGEPKQTYVKTLQNQPRTPNRKKTALAPQVPTNSVPQTPPSLAATSPYLLQLNLASSSPAIEPLQQNTLSDGLNDTSSSLIHQIRALNVGELSYTCLPPEYRHSPSSGFYSCSNSAGSCSPLPADLYPKKTPVIMPSVKSTVVEKPQPQTAVALDSYMVPPPPYQCYQPPIPSRATKPACLPVAPPSYASTMQSLACGRFAETSVPVESSSLPPKRPPKPLPEDKLDAPSNKETRLSPVPVGVVLAVDDEVDRPSFSPQAYKFFIEQRIENVHKSYTQRQYRRMQLELEMQKVGLSADTQCQLREMLSQKESNYLRQKRSAKMARSMFERIRRIGVGAFGEVSLVRKLDTKKLYAMKTLRKADVQRKNQVAHVKAERDILAEADNEWMVKLYFSFQDNDNLYFVMEYIPGGDLMSLLMKLEIFDEELARFYLAELICAVESVHAMGFIHRDIKPDNILIDRDGHIKLTDFGLCTGFRWTHDSKYYESDSHNRQDSFDLSEKWSNETNCKCPKLKPLERRRRREHCRCLAHSLVGTPNYIAPEVLLRTGYTQLCDWWSVGVVLFEMLIGYPPFSANSPLETQFKIVRWKDYLKIPSHPAISAAAVDLIQKLCTSQERRLGKIVSELKEHPFLAGVDFERGVRKLTPPYIPKLDNLTDTSNFEPIFTNEDDDDVVSTSTSHFGSSDDGDADNKQSHGFFEFTFRRFYDSGDCEPFPTKMISTKDEESEYHGAIYV